MIRTLITPFTSRRIVRAVILSSAFTGLAACDGHKATAPEIASASAAEVPSFNKGKGGNQAAPTFPARGFALINETGTLSAAPKAGVANSRRLDTGHYCVELDPQVFPNGSYNFAMAIPRGYPGASVAIGYYGDCEGGVIIWTSFGQSFADLPFHIAIF